MRSDLEALDTHAEWVRALEQDPKPSPMPEPCFKDCYHCPLQKAAESERERRQICARCPWEDLPVGPGERTLMVLELASLPPELIACDLDYGLARDVHTVKMWRASKMGGLFG